MNSSQRRGATGQQRSRGLPGKRQHQTVKRVEDHWSVLDGGPATYIMLYGLLPGHAECECLPQPTNRSSRSRMALPSSLNITPRARPPMHDITPTCRFHHVGLQTSARNEGSFISAFRNLSAFKSLWEPNVVSGQAAGLRFKLFAHTARRELIRQLCVCFLA